MTQSGRSPMDDQTMTDARRIQWKRLSVEAAVIAGEPLLRVPLLFVWFVNSIR
jgi:hypothetical protein